MAAIAVIGDILKTTILGYDFLKSITGGGPGPDYYQIRMEIGNNKDASGNPPSVILTDFADTRYFGVFQGSSKKSSEQCRNNKNLPIGELDGVDSHLFRGLRNGEAPINTYKTRNGFNLKSVDFQGGGNAICISNLIFKGSDTQARRDEIFLPIGDLAYLCDKSWNWGTILGDTRQRCMWLDGQPDGQSKPMESLNLDMERIAGIFNVEREQKLKDLDLKTACSLFKDNTGEVPNRNACKTSFKRNVKTKDVIIDTVPLVNISSTDFSDSKSEFNTNNFVGAGFVTSDNKFFDGQTNIFKEVSPVKDAGSAKDPEKVKTRDLSLQGRDRKIKARKLRKITAHARRHKDKMRKRQRKQKNRPQKREVVANIIKVHTCQATVDGVAPKCSVDEIVSL
ncbi:putative secreted effector protein [Erysiphe neolycopersici]|uniref:Putative secreted effector protein n=1 Tax=Erysiphe neolycopersici TaxID=212602 RepID=A0A420HZX0_9PEZI|nr:putative secreted effector protein [Erysiphe neolycopersici]